jgi:hypothetical protein
MANAPTTLPYQTPIKFADFLFFQIAERNDNLRQRSFEKSRMRKISDAWKKQGLQRTHLIERANFYIAPHFFSGFFNHALLASGSHESD